MRILALDHGTVRIGVAVSDEMQMIAQPVDYVAAEPPEKIVNYLQNEWEGKLELILVGMPRNMDGSYGPAAEKVKVFIEKLKQKMLQYLKKMTSTALTLSLTEK